MGVTRRRMSPIDLTQELRRSAGRWVAVRRDIEGAAIFLVPVDPTVDKW